MTRKLTDEEKKLWQEAMRNLGRVLPKAENVKPVPAASPGAVEARLDLHGLTLEKAHQRFLAFIMESAILEHKKVLVITGKGPEGKSPIRAELPLWAENIGFAKLQVEVAENRHGGLGAYYIKIRQVSL